MNMIRKLKVAAFAFACVGAISSAHAGVNYNGVNLNGLGFNGLGFNGLGFNGLGFNAQVRTRGLSSRHPRASSRDARIGPAE